MKTTRLFLLAMLVSIASSLSVYAQTVIGRQKVDQYPTQAWGVLTYGLTWLPEDYTTSSGKYPLIIFLHGMGECGDGISGLNKLLYYGVPQKIASGWNPNATNPADGKNYKFIVVSPQAPAASKWSYGYGHLQWILADVVKRYRVDTSRIYVTGISAGGAGTWSTVTNGATFAKKISAIVPVSAAGTNTQAEANQLPLVGGTYGAKAWSICGTLDTWYSFSQNATNKINNASPAPEITAKLTGIAGQAHSASVWHTAYDPNWRNNEQKLSAYEWMLQYTRTSTASVAPAPVQAFAGSAQTITLPVSTVALSGSGSATAPNTVTGYSWSKVSGPSSAIITNAATAATTVTGLTAGTYVFRLAVTDNNNTIATSEVTITVQPAPNTLPVANAGADQTIYLPTSSVQLAGTATDADGTIASYSWTKVTGSSATFSNAATANPTVSGLVEGTYTFRLSALDNAGGSSSDEVVISVKADTTSPVKTMPAPSRMQAENWSTMFGVKTETTRDADGVLNVGWQETGDWMDYSINPASSGNHTVNFRVATPNTGVQIQLRTASGTVLSTITVPSSGGWQTWKTFSSSVSLSAGAQTLRIYTLNGKVSGWNFNWFELLPSFSNQAPVVNAGSDKAITLPENSVQLTGTATDADGTITSYNWSKVSGGEVVLSSPAAANPIISGLLAGTYTFLLTATDNSGASASDSVTITVSPALGSNLLESVVPTPVSVKVEAENWSAMSGVKTETTRDTLGGMNVGWIDNGDWMDYSVNLATAGTYTVHFRLATERAGGKLQLRTSGGTVLATVDVPQTMSYQKFVTVPVSVSLPSGQQTLRVQSTAAPIWNINWLEFVPLPSTPVIAHAAAAEEAETATGTTGIYPNPVQDRFVLQVSNDFTGAMTATVYDLGGAPVKTFRLRKGNKGASQSHLSAAGLTTGTYFIKVSMEGWSQTVKMIKQ